MNRIVDFFNTKVSDIVPESFWTAENDDYRNPAYTKENSLLALFPEASEDISIGELLILNRSKARNLYETKDDTDYDVTYQLIYYLAVAVVFSDNEAIRTIYDMEISDFCNILKQISPDNSYLYSILMCFRDDCCTFTDNIYNYYNLEDFEEFFYIGNVGNETTIGNVITLAAKILTAPECYIDYEAADAYQAFIDTDGSAGCCEDRSERLVTDAESVLSSILYAPFFSISKL